MHLPTTPSLFGFNDCLGKNTVAGVSLQNFPVGTAAFLGTTKVLFIVSCLSNLIFVNLKAVTFSSNDEIYLFFMIIFIHTHIFLTIISVAFHPI